MGSRTLGRPGTMLHTQGNDNRLGSWGSDLLTVRSDLARPKKQGLVDAREWLAELKCGARHVMRRPGG